MPVARYVEYLTPCVHLDKIINKTRTNASLAVSNGQLLRTDAALYCIGDKK